MSEIETDAIIRYRRLRRWCDAFGERLVRKHKGHIHCSRGCFGCCVNLTVFPVEFYSILDEIHFAGKRIEFDKTRACGYLDGSGLCVMYPFRPLICRTHGLPIVFADPDSPEPSMCVSFCDLNFRNIDDDYEFNRYNTLNIDNLNRRLFQMNLKFIADNSDLGFEPTSRIDLARLVNFVE